MPDRTCALPGCEEVVTGRRTTCSAAHRQKWHRLKTRNSINKDRFDQQDAETAAQAVESADPVEIAMRVFEQELTPHVRGMIDEDVLRAIRSLVTLTPTLVESLGKDLTAQDAIARGRAQNLVAKYTLGRLEDNEKQNQPLHVHLGDMPRPGEPQPVAAHHGDTVQQCERCEETKTLDHFEPGSGRCNECQTEIKKAIEAKYA